MTAASDARTELDQAIRELEDAATRLRSEEITPEHAASLVEEVAQLAARVGTALDRQAADARGEWPPGQEKLL